MSTAPEHAPEPKPPFLKGVFSLYETPDGGYHLAWRAEGGEADEHLDVPGFLVKMARKGGGPMGMLRMLPKMGG